MVAASRKPLGDGPVAAAGACLIRGQGKWLLQKSAQGSNSKIWLEPNEAEVLGDPNQTQT